MKKKLDVCFIDDFSVVISGKCVFTGEFYSVIVNRDEYIKWERGELIQRAMPNLSAEKREFLISGISPKGWKQTFGE